MVKSARSERVLGRRGRRGHVCNIEVYDDTAETNVQKFGQHFPKNTLSKSRMLFLNTLYMQSVSSQPRFRSTISATRVAKASRIQEPIANPVDFSESDVAFCINALACNYFSPCRRQTFLAETLILRKNFSQYYVFI